MTAVTATNDCISQSTLEFDEITVFSEAASPPVQERAGSVGGSSQASIPSRGSDSSLESPASGELAPEWHHTPRWKGTSVFCDHTLRHLSKLSNVGFPQAEVSCSQAPPPTLLFPCSTAFTSKN